MRTLKIWTTCISLVFLFSAMVGVGAGPGLASAILAARRSADRLPTAGG